MSDPFDPFEKFLAQEKTQGTKARATRKQVEARHGLYARLVRTGELEPYELWVRIMGERTEVWRHVSGKGLEAIFEEM